MGGSARIAYSLLLKRGSTDRSAANDQDATILRASLETWLVLLLALKTESEVGVSFSHRGEDLW